jgi:hypothetical protein
MTDYSKLDFPGQKKKRDNKLGLSLLLLGTMSAVGYGALKRKIFGNPTSKIRKGLFYATLAGVVLYKCQGDNVKKTYDILENKAQVMYSDFRNNKQLKEENLYIERVADSLFNLKNSLEEKMKEYIINDSMKASEKKNFENELLEKNRKKDSLLRNLTEKNRKKDSILLTLNERNTALLKQNAELHNKEKSYQTKIIVQESSKKQTLTLEEIYKEYYKSVGKFSDDYRVALEISKYSDNAGRITLKTHGTYTDQYWIISDGKSDFIDIAKMYYNNPDYALELSKINKFQNTEKDVTIGYPIFLPQRGLLNFYNVYRGTFPKSILVDVNSNLDEVLACYYSKEQKSFDAVNEAKKFNRIYNIDAQTVRNEAISLGHTKYVMIMPSFAEQNISTRPRPAVRASATR